MKQIKVAIVGYGFVGKAVSYALTSSHIKQFHHDPKLGTNIKDLISFDPQFVFICVPTPMSDNGTIDSSIVETVFEQLRPLKKIYASTTIVLKSTVTPDIIDKLESKAKFVYNPEFLTERSACADFVSAPFHVFGGEESAKVAELFKNYSSCDTAEFFFVSNKEASMIKYGINSFLATKVTFFNQLFGACEKEGLNSNMVLKVIGADPRIGSSHTKVPGFDGKLGYGGSCFPKDTNAICNYNSDLTLVRESVKINNYYRSEYELDDREREMNVKFKNEN